MMKKRSLVILGATASGIAIAVHRPDALLLEPGTLLAGEWLASMNIKPDDGRPMSAETEELRAQCRNMQALSSDGRIYAPALVSLMASKLKSAGTEIIFQAQIIAVQSMHGGFLVSWMDCAGMHAVLADKLVDTRNRGGRKSLCTVLSADSRPEEYSSPRYQIMKGYLPYEYVVKWHLAPDAGWPLARSIVHEGIMQMPHCRLAAIAPLFCFDHNEALYFQEEDGCIICCSASYQNLFAAWEGGIACATDL